MRWLQLLIFNSNCSIEDDSFIWVQSNSSKYCHLMPIIKFLHTVIGFQVLLCTSNNSIKRQSFIYTQLNNETVLFLTIYFNRSFLCPQFKFQTSIAPIDRTLSGATTLSQSGSGRNGNERKNTRWSGVGFYFSSEIHLVYFTAPAWLLEAKWLFVLDTWNHMTVWKLFVFDGLSYLPTPPLGQDMTQGQFLSGV